MADKEAVVYIVDLGSTMADCNNGRTESDLDWSMRYVWDKISTTVAASRKTWTLGVVGLRTDETNNTLSEEDGYENISILTPIGPMDLSSMNKLGRLIKPSDTMNGDAVSAIVLAVDMIDKYTKKLKYNRVVYLITDGKGEIDGDDLDDIADKINASNIELKVIGVDFDDDDYGFKEEDKPSSKAKNEKVLKQLTQKCEKNLFATMAEAIEDLAVPRIKSVRPIKSYSGPLTLGNPNDFESAISINVERYFKTKPAPAPASSNVVVKSEGGEASQSTHTMEGDALEGVEPTGGDLSAVRFMRTYKVKDPDAPGGKRDVEYDSLAKGYEYGRTAVYISESDWNVTKIETTSSFSIIGFVPTDKYEPILNMGPTCMSVAAKFDERSELALLSLINALYELESYAVARLVTKDGKEPELLLLIPGIDVDVRCLYDIPLPYAEDVRSYPFPPLDKVITVTGNTLLKHRLLPGDELNEAMDAYVDAMDLSGFNKDDEGNPAEYAPIEDVYAPTNHRLNQVIRFRATHPNEPVPPIPEILMRYSQPPEELVEKSKPEIDDLIQVADVKKVPLKAKGRRAREAIKPISGLDVDSLLEKRKTISPENAIPEYKQALATADDVSAIKSATKQMGAIVRTLVTDSFGDLNDARIVETMGVMRSELIALEEPELYNTFFRDFKKAIQNGELGPDRRWFWNKKIRFSSLGLIHTGESEVSKVSGEDAKKFMILG